MELDELKNCLIENIEVSTTLIDDMCNYIYKGEGDRIFENLNDFIDKLDFILSNSCYVSECKDLKKIDEILIEMEQAIAIKEYVLLTDILNYELKPIFENLIHELKSKS